MNKEVITNKQAVFLVGIFIIGTTIIMSGREVAHQDLWISILVAISSFMPMIFVYSAILSFFPGKNLYEVLEISFGKTIGKVISLLFIIYFLYLGTLVLRNITEFIQTTLMPQTPQYYSALWFLLISVYMVSCGIEVFARWSNLVFVFIIILILISMVPSVKHYNFENMLPILYKGWKPIFQSSFSMFTFPFGETVTFLAIFHTLKNGKKVWIPYSIGILIAGGLILIVSVRNMLLLGFPLTNDVYFPSYYASSLITIGNFVEGIEMFSAIILVVAGLAKLSTCIFAICIGLGSVFDSKGYSKFTIPMGILLLISSQVIFSNTMEMTENIKFYKYHAFPFQVILPLIILLFGWRKKKRLSKIYNKSEDMDS